MLALALSHCCPCLRRRHLGERTLQAALHVLAAAVEGVGGGHRHAPAVQHEVFRAVERLLGSRDAVSAETRLACASVLRALGACGGAFLWASSLAGFEAVKALCLAGLEDPSHAVRAAFAQALGQIAVASTSGEHWEVGRRGCICCICAFCLLHTQWATEANVQAPHHPNPSSACPDLFLPTDAAKDSVRQLERKPKNKAAQEKALAEVPTACLTTPFVEAASYSNRASCTALAQAWAVFLTASRAGMEEQVGLAGWLKWPAGSAARAAATSSWAQQSCPLGHRSLNI